MDVAAVEREVESGTRTLEREYEGVLNGPAGGEEEARLGT